VNNIYLSTIKTLVKRFPAVVPHLSGRARWLAHSRGEYKTYDYFLRQLEGLVRGVYAGNIGGAFIDTMANLISGQLNQAFSQAWKDEGTGGAFPEYLQSAAEALILTQYEHVDQYYRDIVDARIDKLPIDSLLARAALWAQRWTEAYNQAVALITAEMGGNMVWTLGATEEHCETCAGLNGIVARASEWDELGIHPQGAPNDALECGGWRCDCSLTPTDKRRSPKAYESIMNTVSK